MHAFFFVLSRDHSQLVDGYTKMHGLWAVFNCNNSAVKGTPKTELHHSFASNYTQLC